MAVAAPMAGIRSHTHRCKRLKPKRISLYCHDMGFGGSKTGGGGG